MKVPADGREGTMSKVGDDLVEAFQEMAAFLRGEGEVEEYEIAGDMLMPPESEAPEAAREALAVNRR